MAECLVVFRASRVADGAWWPKIWSWPVRRVSHVADAEGAWWWPEVAVGVVGTKLLRTLAVSFIIQHSFIHRHPEKETNIGGQESAGLPLSNSSLG